MAKQHPRPTESELTILQILWSEGPSTVREVNNVLNVQKENEVGYTTTLKHLQIMAEKKLVSRDTSTRTHIYKPNILEEDTQKNLVKGLIEKVFGGSAMDLVLQALGNHNASPEELAEIKKLIQELENKKS